MRGIHLKIFTSRMVTSISERLENYIETDFHGDGSMLVDYVRVRLFLRIETPLRFKRLFQFGDESILLKFCYEKLRNFFSLCGLMTHDTFECPSKEPEDAEEPDGNDDDNDDDYPPKT